MKDWLEKDAVLRRPARARFRQNLPDNIIIAVGSVFYTALLAWPVYSLISGSGILARELTILGGLIGLGLASYAVMSNRVAEPLRLPIGFVGVLLIIACWGFGPL